MKPNKARRRTMLYIPGNNPGMLQNGPIFGADSVGMFKLAGVVGGHLD